MSRILIQEAFKQVGQKAAFKGWVYNLRVLKGLIFVVLRDISGQIQLVISENDSKEAYEEAKKLNLESVVEVEGEIKEKISKKEDAPKEYEVLVSDLKIISLAEEQLPIPVLHKVDNEADVELRFDWRFLDLRQPEKQMIFKVWTELEAGFREYFNQSKYVQLYSPSFMSTPSETGAEVFEVKYFDKKAYLAQSPQFYKQMAMAAGLEKIFMIGPVFRAEPSFTSRHVTEFTGWDFEISFISGIEDIMREEENMIISGFKRVKENLNLEIEVPQVDFPKISFKEAKEILKSLGVKGEKEHDFSPEEERAIADWVKKEKQHDFVFITNYPKEARPFYHMLYEDDKATTKSFDLLYRGLEITTGAQREHRYEILKAQAIEKGMDINSLEDYLNFFRYGCPDHGGAGIGPARIVMKLLDLDNVKEACYLPRDVRRLKP